MIFEMYTRQLIANGTAEPYQYRPCVEVKNPKYNMTGTMTFDGCEEIQLLLDIVKAASATPNVIFHSINQQNKLIDFLYQDGNGIFHAFQATISATHKADRTQIKVLEKAVGGWEKLNLYYLVPDRQCARFCTDPVDPKQKMKLADIKKKSAAGPQTKGAAAIRYTG